PIRWSTLLDHPKPWSAHPDKWQNGVAWPSATLAANAVSGWWGKHLDDLTRHLAAYAARTSFGDLTKEAIDAAILRIVDSLACAIAAYDCETAAIGRRLAAGAAPDRYRGRILGFGDQTTAEAAAFVNTCLIRALDFNDQYPSGHPSDCLGALLALAEAAGADGSRFLTSAIVAYELFIRLNDATTLRQQGWDQGYIIGLSTAAGVGNLLGLPAEAIGEAIAITAVANLPMRNTRAGELSLWKGAATAYAVRNGVFGALLAAEGMTGPERPFDGIDGLWQQITGPFEIAPFADEGGAFRIADVNMKFWPVEYNAQIVVWAALQLREQPDWRDLVSIDVATYSFTVSEIAGGPERWDPKTRETADHSLPYIFARTLVDGTMTAASFEETAVLDPALRPLMAKIKVRADERFDAIYPATIAMQVDAMSTDGRRNVIDLRDPLGHEKNPMQEKDVRAKFQAAVETVLGPQRSAAALTAWLDLPNCTELPAAMALLNI
ncbi:MAG TPA: MmgE/PrpD family protein, partial [Bryobacteraceae bacterium]|nr:MmgE/PrpD family protein [Bryobacteraceae bacterium]